MHAINTAGVCERQIIGGKRGTVRLQDSGDIAGAGYVDNFGVLGCDADEVNAGLRRISDVLRRWGLTVHEVEEAQYTGDFVGLHFDGRTGYMSIQRSRPYKIRSAIQELLRLKCCSGVSSS